MQLGFVSAILPELSLEEVFVTAAELDYECVELMCWPRGKAERRYAGVTHVDVEGFDKSAAANVQQLAAQHGVSVSGLGYYPNPLSPDTAEAEQAAAQIRKVIAACATMELPRMNTFVGRNWQVSVDDNWPRFLDVWKPIIEYAESLGVSVGIENCPMFFTNDEWPGGKNLATSPSIWRRMFEAIPSSRFGLNYDPSHMIWQHMDYLNPLEEFASRIFHVHAKDVRIDRHRLNQVGIMANPLEFHTPKLPGMGDVDWGRFFSVLSETGYQGPVCVEVEGSGVRSDSGVSQSRLAAECHVPSQLPASSNLIRRFGIRF